MTNRTVTLANGVAMPLVGFGTWQLRGDEAYRAVRHALDVGYRHLDTATIYGNEAEVGRAVRDSGIAREELFLTSKLPPGEAGREREVLGESLRALDTAHLDLWLIHAPPREDAGVPVWQRFREVRDEGLVRAIGVSNYDVAQLDRLAEVTGELPTVNQVPWSPAHHDPHTLAEHHERAVVLEGHSPLKSTRLDDSTLAQIAERHQVTPAQVVLRWHLEHRIPVIPKSGTPERIARNFDLYSFALTPEERSRIDAL